MVAPPSSSPMAPLPHFRRFRLLSRETLVAATPESLAVHRLTFALPESTTLGLDLGHGEYVKLYAPSTRKPKSYSPTSPPSRKGSFDLTVKEYPGGATSGFLARMEVGDSVRVAGPVPPRVFRMRRRGGARVCVVVMGIGITEALHVMTSELESKDGVEKVTMLYANRTPADELFTEELAALERAHPSRFRVVRIFSREAVEGALYGRIDARVMTNTFDLENEALKDEQRFLVVGNKPFKKNIHHMLTAGGFSKDKHALLVKGYKERV